MNLPGPTATAPDPGPKAERGRLLSLDVLRAVAILLVLGHHFPVPHLQEAPLLDGIGQGWHLGGWIGVDLFFVLSGFLVSGLLFGEHRRHGVIRYGRFLARRGFKIYPAFYALIAATVVLRLATEGEIWWRALFDESLFIQNYGPRLWVHTWSLAVEEHFYLLLPGALFLVLRSAGGRPDPFARLLPALGILAVAVLALRVGTAWRTPFDPDTHLFPTHLRVDSLTFGVVLAYAYNYHHERFLSFGRRHFVALLLGGVALLAPAFVFDVIDTPYLFTFGLTELYLGSGMLLVALVARPLPRSRVTSAMGYCGMYSYSIYLWHMPVRELVDRVLVKRLPGWAPEATAFLLFVLLSVGQGILAARLIEYPVLRLRDRWMPSASRAV